MPGLAGFSRGGAEGGASVLQAMLDRLRHGPDYRLEVLALAEGLCLGAAFPPAGGTGYTACADDGLSLWLDGELYNREELAPGSTGDAEFLAGLCRAEDWSGLAAVDGVFVALAYQPARRRVLLFNDRHGLKPLYWTRWRGGLAWAAEYKAFVELPGFVPNLDARALPAFVALGYLYENGTWLEGVERLPAATVLQWDWPENTLQSRRYWSWDRVTLPAGDIQLPALAEELGGVFRRGVERRCRPDRGPVGLSLSGGLDSRAILAGMPAATEPVPLLTFGAPDSGDNAIAATVAAQRPTRHHWIELGGEDWLAPRLAAVWWTDGMLDLRHMHGVEALAGIRRAYAVGLNGAGGDGLAGGGHLFEAVDFDDHLRRRLAFDPAVHADLAAELRSYFDRLGSAHAFYIDHRMRSFTLYGLLLGTFAGVGYRMPFMDNAFQERLYAAPAAFKAGNRLYRQLLLRAFPDYFRRIPWQSTGVPLSWPPWAARLARRWRRGAPLADYAAWIRRPPARSFFERALLGDDALCAAYAPEGALQALWNEHMAGLDRSDLLCRWLTLEVFLRQMLKGEWRPDPREGLVTP